MLNEIKTAFHSELFKGVKTRLIVTYAFLAIFNIGTWIVAVYMFWDYPTLLALCALAYGFGLRHAVDADHIAAIDNVTRKFIQQKKTPVSIGTFFSLGHSTVVILMSVVVALGISYAKSHLDYYENIGNIVGTLVSSIFLFILAFINLFIFIDTFRTFIKVKNSPDKDNISADDEILVQKGFMTKVFRFAFKFVNRSWQMYIVGFLFGLGFDTASEIALLGISASQASLGVSIWVIMVYPLLFTAGMCLIDTTDGVLMVGVYGWAFVKPLRRLFYNMTITLVSVIVSLFIGGLEALAMIASEFNLQNGIWYYVNRLNDKFGYMGYCIIGIFIISWIISTLVYKYCDFDKKNSPCLEKQ